MRAVDGCAGPGGWSEACRALGIDEVGIEVDRAACETRHAAGHATLRRDVTAAIPDLGDVDGVIFSPPCQAFSRAGDRAGHDDMSVLLDRIDQAASGWRDDLRLGHLHGVELFPSWHDPTSPLVLEPLRWTWHLRPTWVALEQVPDVLPAWRAIAETLAAWGYRTWCGNLLAADYGVPQTRTRAFLLAHTTREVLAPAPTHAKDGAGGLLPWVTMAEALGGAPGGTVRTGANTMTTRAGAVKPYERDTDRPAPTVVGNAGRWLWSAGAAPHRRDRNGTVRHESEPAQTIAVGHAVPMWLNTGRDWKPGGTRADAQTIPPDQPAPTLTCKSGEQWWWTRPATTVCGDARNFAPGHHPNAADGPDAGSRNDDAVKLTLTEALILQGFRPDYPVCGNLSEQYEQVGNAVPPPLAEAVLRKVAA